MYRQVKRPSGLLASWTSLRLMRLCTFQQWMAAVPVMKWEDLLDAHPRSHLVVAWLYATHRTGEGRVASFDLLKRAATALDPRGDWALTDAKVGEIYEGRGDIYRLRGSGRRGAIVYLGACQTPWS